jgi:hypothetical protein
LNYLITCNRFQNIPVVKTDFVSVCSLFVSALTSANENSCRPIRADLLVSGDTALSLAYPVVSPNQRHDCPKREARFLAMTVPPTKQSLPARAEADIRARLR